MWGSCAVPEAVQACSSPCGPGQRTCIDGSWGPCAGPDAGAPKVTAQLWDFQFENPIDFGAPLPEAVTDRGDPGIVQPTLGPDDTPVYNGHPTTPTTSGAANFYEWFHDGSVSMTTFIPLSFGPSASDPTTYASHNPDFFPGDNQLFGNETVRGRSHNYYFTVAVALQFRYRGGETFHLASDDDSWMFINRQLAVDLGGPHEVLRGSVDLDANRGKLGISVGQIYTMNVFYADRYAFSAVLDVDVPAADFAVCSDGGLP
jgi:fibro-slime domain-containing protein